MSRRKQSRILMSLGIILIACALGLAGYDYYMDLRAGSMATHIATQIEKNITHNPKNKDYFVVDGVAYLGYLVVPELKLILPVAKNWHFEQLRLTPCTYSGSQMDHNWVIAGHNYRRHFSYLKTLNKGDSLYFINASGDQINYVVDKTEILQPTQVNEMTDSGYDLSLFTCTYSGTSRFTLRCHQVNA